MLVPASRSMEATKTLNFGNEVNKINSRDKQNTMIYLEPDTSSFTVHCTPSGRLVVISTARRLFPVIVERLDCFVAFQMSRDKWPKWTSESNANDAFDD